MKHLFTPLFLLVCAVLFPCGCANTGALVVSGLRVELTSIERHSDGTAVANLRVVNPNVTPYLVAQINAKVYLNGSLVGTIDAREPMGVPREDSAAKSVKLQLAGPAADQILVAAGQQGPVSYRVNATLVIQIYGDENEKGEVTHSGTVAVVSK